MPGLADLVRKGVAIADRVTGTLQVEVRHYACTGHDEYGKPVHSSSPVKRKAIVDRKQKLLRTGASDGNGGRGEEVLAQIYIGFLRPVTVSTLDKFVLPDGTTGPTLSAEGFVDADTETGYYAEVWLG